MFAFFLLSSRDDPFFLANTRIIIIISSSSPNFSPPSRREGDEKTKQQNERKIKIVPSLSKKGRAFLPFFRRVDADIFFRAENISIPPLFLSANTLNVLKNPKQKIQKKVVFPKKNVCLLCVSHSLSLDAQPRRSSKSRRTTAAHRVVVVVMNDETNRTTNKRGGGEGELPEHNAKKLREEEGRWRDAKSRFPRFRAQHGRNFRGRGVRARRRERIR